MTTLRSALGRRLLVGVFAMGLAGAALVPVSCNRGKEQEKAGPLICHVGGTMRPVIQKLAEMYEKDTGQKIEINPADSGELLAHIEGHKEGDLYVCHDPFVDRLMKKFKMGDDAWMIAQVTPVIVVRKGNPKGITGLKSLEDNPDLEVWLTDYEHSTLGNMLKTMFTKAGVNFDELTKRKTAHTTRGGGQAANMVQTKNADAAICWNAVAFLRKGELDVVPIIAEHLPAPGVDAVTSATGKKYMLAPVRVTLATLTCSKQPKAAKAFAEFVASDKAAKVFADFGFTTCKAKMLYENGKPVKETGR